MRRFDELALRLGPWSNMGVPGNEAPADDTPELAAAKRCGDPYLVYRDAHARQRVLSLPDTWDQITIGRGMGADVALTWDPDVSRVHAELSRLADDWTVIDDGLSRNGTFVNDQRVEGRRRLMDGDVLRCGATQLLFHSPFQADDQTRAAQTLP
jgi:hypothetical protein